MGAERHGPLRGVAVFASALALALGALGGVAAANHDFFQLVSAGQINGNGVFDTDFSGVSADGTRAFFITNEQLVAADTDASTDLYERSGGTTKQVSAGQINGNGAFNAFFVGASADGTRVFFFTAEPLVAADTDASVDVYERSGGTTKRVSAGQIKGNGAFGANFEGASADGTRVFFSTNEKLVAGDTDASNDVYQRSGGTTKRVSAGQINGNGALPAFFAGASADGTRVVFITNEQLVAADTDASQDVYERSAGTTTKISPGNGAFPAFFNGASADGARVFFQTAEQLVSGDTDASTDLYQRSAGGTTNRVSAGEINGNGAFNTTFDAASADGTRVFFDSSEKLVPTDIDSSSDVYERSGGTTKRVSAGQINGNGAFSALFDGASTDGARVFFETSEKLVAADADASTDIYERSGGTTSRVSAGNGAFNAGFEGATPDGSALFFETEEKVIANDEDGSVDVYGAYVTP